MNNNNSLEQVHIVAYGLATLLHDIAHTLQALLSASEIFPNRIMQEPSNDWYALAYTALLKSLALDVVSLSGNAKYGHDSNCNFKELKNVILLFGNNTPTERTIIEAIDTFLDKYKDLISADLRNKVIAHKDLDYLFNGKDFNVDLININRYLLEGYEIVSAAFELAIGAKLKEPDLDAIRNQYTASIALP